jgi:hypothetical protein
MGTARWDFWQRFYKDVKMQLLPLYLLCNVFTTVLLCLVSYVLYHLAQLNFLHFMSIFADF